MEEEGRSKGVCAELSEASIQVNIGDGKLVALSHFCVPQNTASL